MKNLKENIYGLLVAALASLTSCEGSDIPLQHADHFDYISFSAKTEKTETRANPYEDYNAAKHPETMGVIGYYNIDSYFASTSSNALNDKANPMFDNTKISYSTDQTWTYDPVLKWDEYRGAKSFDFFAYMPDLSSASSSTDAAALPQVTKSGENTYTLSIPFLMPKANATEGATPFLSAEDTKQMPLICATPEHKEGTDAAGKQFTFERSVNLKFDQALTAYSLSFELDKKMGAIRQFHIKSIKISGNIATSGTLTRTYTLSGTTWTAQAIKWKDLKYQTVTDLSLLTEETNLPIEDGTIKAFYTIPDSKFNPTITVTYDVEMKDQDGTTVVTRKDVTSTIELSKKNFASLTSGTAIINPIHILIQPRYLYVLTDQDAYTGYLLID